VGASGPGGWSDRRLGEQVEACRVRQRGTRSHAGASEWLPLVALVQNYSEIGILLLMALRGVEQAAEELEVTPRRVRQMIADGTLEGQRVGAVWVIDERALRLAAQRRRAAHRPWNSASAWAVLALADGAEPACTPGQRSRAPASGRWIDEPRRASRLPGPHSMVLRAPVGGLALGGASGHRPDGSERLTGTPSRPRRLLATGGVHPTE